MLLAQSWQYWLMVLHIRCWNWGVFSDSSNFLFDPKLICPRWESSCLLSSDSMRAKSFSRWCCLTACKLVDVCPHALSLSQSVKGCTRVQNSGGRGGKGGKEKKVQRSNSLVSLLLSSSLKVICIESGGGGKGSAWRKRPFLLESQVTLAHLFRVGGWVKLSPSSSLIWKLLLNGKWCTIIKIASCTFSLLENYTYVKVHPSHLL